MTREVRSLDVALPRRVAVVGDACEAPSALTMPGESCRAVATRMARLRIERGPVVKMPPRSNWWTSWREATCSSRRSSTSLRRSAHAGAACRSSLEGYRIPHPGSFLNDAHRASPTWREFVATPDGFPILRRRQGPLIP
jgi:hypothetical protein